MMLRNQQIREGNKVSLQKGAAAVEFALVIIFLLMVVGGIIELGRAFWYYDALTKATRDGARVMSMADSTTINSVGVPAAQDAVVFAANSARISPALTSANVQVQCLNADYVVVSCVNGVAPESVRVAVVGFNVVLGAWFPLFRPSGDTPGFDASSFATIPLSPQTTMPYMQ